ncbi:MAG: hypothetical protein ACLPY1_19625, partial [Terracidiphilus sp.]
PLAAHESASGCNDYHGMTDYGNRNSASPLPGVTQRDSLVLCHGLCHNPAIPAGVGLYLSVSLGHTQKAAILRETRMNTASLCRFVSLSICSYSFALGNGMEEVIGSIPIRSTNYIDNLASRLKITRYTNNTLQD